MRVADVSPCAVMLFCLTAALCVGAEIYFEEDFPDDSFETEWTYSEHPGKAYGRFIHSAGTLYNDAEADKGIRTAEDSRFYALSKKFKPFSNEGKNLVVQYTVKHEQVVDCCGGYVKLFNCDLDPKQMHGETPYEIMFGPDICGPAVNKVHVIFSYNGKNVLFNKDIRCPNDVYTHIYTLIVKPDNTYEVLIDNKKVESGELEADWDFLPPKKIKDPEIKKPEDGNAIATIDVTARNTQRYLILHKYNIFDKDNAKSNNDVIIEMPDGPIFVDKLDYKSDWEPKQADNPKYKGVWLHAEIVNPEYKRDDKLYLRKEICALGFDLWQVRSGTVFNNILITDDIEVAKDKADDIIKLRIEGEKNMMEAHRKKTEQEAKIFNNWIYGDIQQDNEYDVLYEETLHYEL